MHDHLDLEREGKNKHAFNNMIVEVVQVCTRLFNSRTRLEQCHMRDFSTLGEEILLMSWTTDLPSDPVLPLSCTLRDSLNLYTWQTSLSPFLLSESYIFSPSSPHYAVCSNRWKKIEADESNHGDHDLLHQCKLWQIPRHSYCTRRVRRYSVGCQQVLPALQVIKGALKSNILSPLNSLPWRELKNSSRLWKCFERRVTCLRTSCMWQRPRKLNGLSADLWICQSAECWSFQWSTMLCSSL